MYHRFYLFICSWTLKLFPGIVNNGAMNIRMHRLFQIDVLGFLWYNPRSSNSLLFPQQLTSCQSQCTRTPDKLLRSLEKATFCWSEYQRGESCAQREIQKSSEDLCFLESLTASWPVHICEETLWKQQKELPKRIRGENLQNVHSASNNSSAHRSRWAVWHWVEYAQW